MINPFKIQKQIEKLKKQQIDEINIFSTTTIHSEIDLLENKKNFIFQIITLVFSIALSGTAILISVGESNRNADEFGLRVRPYLVIDNVDISVDTSTTITKYAIHIKNSGSVPAIINSRNVTCTLDDEKNISRKVNEDAINRKVVVGVESEILYSFSLKKFTTGVCEYIITYDSAISNSDSILGAYKTTEILQFISGEKPSVSIIDAYMN